MKSGDLIYCRMFDEYGTIIRFSHREPDVDPDCDGAEDIFIILWSTGEVTAHRETILEVISEI